MPSSKKDFGATFERLRAILKKYEKRLVVSADGPGGYVLETKYNENRRKPIFFGGVRRGKSYVSFHLMPVYACPDLLKDISPSLRKRMQGKSCFNFRSIEAETARELAALTEKGFRRFATEFIG